MRHPGTFRRYVLPENVGLPNKQQPPFEKADVPDNAYPDGEIAEQVIQDLERAKAAGTPFFITAGFTKPHLPFNAPSKYWDLYQREDFSLPDNYFVPEGAPREAMHKWNELRGQYGGVPQEGPVSDALALHLIHGYYATVSYADAMIGKVLDALERLEMADNTIVILWGDHGWQLGEHTLWCKHALFRTSLNAPLILSAPGYQGGQKSSSLVEFVDIYPTLCDLAGIEAPAHLQGKSLRPLLENPEAPFKMAVYSRYHSGEAVKTLNLSYAEWRSGGRMLYNHRNDPDENINRVDDPKYAAVLSKISALLKTHRQKVREADAAYAASVFGSEMISSNQPPAWRPGTFSQKPAKVGEAYSTYVNFRASDPEEDGLVYAKVSGPEWIQLTNPGYGRFQGTPGAGDVGESVLKVTVSDGINEPVEATMKVMVQGAP
jgi:arylsulfatase A-like enzyme